MSVLHVHRTSFVATPPAPVTTTYRVVQPVLDGSAYGHITAEGKVAFTAAVDDGAIGSVHGAVSMSGQPPYCMPGIHTVTPTVTSN